MSISLRGDQAPWAWFNVAHWQPHAGGVMPWRIAPDLVATAHNEHFRSRVLAAAGVRAEVLTDAGGLDLELRPSNLADQDRLTVDVVFDGALVERFELEDPKNSAAATTAHIVLPGTFGRLEIWLPHEGGVVVQTAHLNKVTRCDPVSSRPRWVTYGSSITHCIEADGPSETWPALVARNLGLELYCLGLAAQCHLDYAVEATINSLQATYISLCLGINIYGRGSFDERSLPSALHGFIARVRAGQPNAELVIISPLTSPPSENKTNSVDLTLARIRQLVEQVAADFSHQGVHLISGPQIIGPAQAKTQLRSDELHPHAAGYRFMASALTPRLAAAFDLPYSHSTPREV